MTLNVVMPEDYDDSGGNERCALGRAEVPLGAVRVAGCGLVDGVAGDGDFAGGVAGDGSI